MPAKVYHSRISVKTDFHLTMAHRWSLYRANALSTIA
jgi:hypothetical protein